MDDTETKQEKLQILDSQIRTCNKCRLCETATNAVPGEGDPDSEIIFVGEAPGKNEDEQGRPFVGRAGKLLEFLLNQIGYKRENVWIGNIIKHRPPDNRDPLPEEINVCKPYLTKQIEIIAPKLIVPLGRFSMNYFLPSAKISQAHGKVHRMSDFAIYPVYHPAAGLRNPTMKAALVADFLRIPEVLKEIKTKQEQDRINPSSSFEVGQKQNLVKDNSSDLKLF